jgi:hypothetical protein
MQVGHRGRKAVRDLPQGGMEIPGRASSMERYRAYGIAIPLGRT